METVYIQLPTLIVFMAFTVMVIKKGGYITDKVKFIITTVAQR